VFRSTTGYGERSLPENYRGSRAAKPFAKDDLERVLKTLAAL
jgi:hypothetical protein